MKGLTIKKVVAIVFAAVLVITVIGSGINSFTENVQINMAIPTAKTIESWCARDGDQFAIEKAIAQAQEKSEAAWLNYQATLSQTLAGHQIAPLSFETDLSLVGIVCTTGVDQIDRIAATNPVSATDLLILNGSAALQQKSIQGLLNEPTLKLNSAERALDQAVKLVQDYSTLEALLSQEPPGFDQATGFKEKAAEEIGQMWASLESGEIDKAGLLGGLAGVEIREANLIIMKAAPKPQPSKN